MIIINTKICKKCNKEKKLSEYYTQNKVRSNGEEYIYYNPTCIECILNAMHENYEENYKRLKEHRRKNPKATRDVARRYRKKNLEKVNADQKRWRQENKDKVKLYNEKHKDKMFKITPDQWNKCKEYFNDSCAYCGISEKEAKIKYNKVLHREHAINEGNNDLSNCIPSCTGCNSLKNKYDYIDWYTPNNPLYNVERMNLIEKWLEEDHKNYILETKTK